ncbi:hypothetical protein HUB97_12085 [Halorubraceae archaeon YAN]|nr:hypothetical protein [Halorubraceae archaeon YAN]
MTGQRAAADPTVRSFDAEIRSIDRTDVVLDHSYFYAESGGQPADRGTIAGISVEAVQEGEEGHVHTLSAPIDAAIGETVPCVIDAPFRTYCMRAHTASHALYGAGRRLLDDLGYGGFDIDAEKVRVDFVTPTKIDDSVLVELERLVNRVVWDSLSVSWEEVPVETAREMEEIAFNTKTEDGAMANGDSVRVVTIHGTGDGDDPWDVAACGGTHVANTNEIGPISVLSRSNPGEGMTRVEFAVGPVGIEQRKTVHQAAIDAAHAAETGITELPNAVDRLTTTQNELRAEVTALKSRLLKQHIRGFDRVGDGWAVGTVDGFDATDAGTVAKDVVGDEMPVVAVVGSASAPFVVIASTGSPSAGELVNDVTSEFGGGGGGSETFAQGGGLSGDLDAVVSFLTECAASHAHE